MTRPSDLSPVTAGGRMVYRGLRLIGVVLTAMLWRVRVDGTERLPSGVPFVVAPTHRSYVDFLVIGVAFPRLLRFMVKNSIWKSSWAGRLASYVGSFPVDREHADRAALRSSEQAVLGGDPVVMFPEGRRKVGLVVDDLHDGPVWVACRTRVPVVPVGLAGTDRAMPVDRRTIRFARVHVVIGEPIYPDIPLEGRIPRRVVTEGTEQLRASLQDLQIEAQRRLG